MKASDESVVTLLRDQLRKTPLTVALDDGQHRWTYQDLHARADRIADLLQRNGISPGDRVGVCMPRTNDAVAAIIGVLVAGGAYVPLDPTYPPERLALMCERAAMKLILGPAGLTSRLSIDVLRLDPTDRAGDSQVPSERRPVYDGALPAYVLFTSGSTGTPKGVQVSHRNVVALLRWARTAFSPGEFGATALGASFNFDVSVFEMFAPLTAGGMVRVLRNALSLGVMGSDDPITLAFTTPSVLGELMRLGRVPDTLRTLIVGGEVFPSALARSVLEQTSVGRLMTVYGPTETTVLTTQYELTLPVDDPLPIGRELPGLRHFILDAQLNPVVDGEVGELSIAGDQVADGYLNDPVQTAERFITWERPPGPAQRIYRSGDLGRRRPDGVLEFHGRNDKQIKVRGYRIEPGEIEAVMSRQPGVAQAFVRSVGDGAAAKLVGYVVPGNGTLVIDDLMAALRAALTPYMVPVGVLIVPRFSLTPSGKLDEAELPAWAPPMVDTDARSGQVLGEDETMVAALICEQLGLNRPIGPDVDFIDDLGGTSLQLVNLLAAMEQVFHCRLRIDQVVADTTLAGLAGLVHGDTGVSVARMVLHGGGTKPPLFLFHAYLGAVLRYRRLEPYLSADRPLVAICARNQGDTENVTSIGDMAERVLAQVLDLQPTGPYRLGGHSAGGLIAYEVACRLVEMGAEVSNLIILDSPVTSPRWRYYWAETVLNWSEVRHASAAVRLARIRRAVMSRLSLHRRGNAQNRVEVAIEQANRLSNLACLRYVTPNYTGDMCIFRSAQGIRMAAGDRSLGWARHVGGIITYVDIEGGHTTMFEPEFVASLAGHINDVLGDELAIAR